MSSTCYQDYLNEVTKKQMCSAYIQTVYASLYGRYRKQCLLGNEEDKTTVRHLRVKSSHFAQTKKK